MISRRHVILTVCAVLFADRICVAAPTLYTANSNGVYRSTDWANSWTFAGTGLPGSPVLALAVDPTNSDVVYAGTAGGALFMTTNGGLSWMRSSSGLTDTIVTSIAIDMRSPQVVYAGTATSAFFPGQQVFKSTDGGQHWSVANSGLPGMIVSAVRIDPSDSSVLYVGLNAGGVYRSGNGGLTWGAANRGLENRMVTDVAIHPSVPGTVYAATDAGVFKSTDRGDHWTPMNSGFSDLQILAVAFDGVNSEALYAASRLNGIFRTTNGGLSWLPVNPGYMSALTGLSRAVLLADSGSFYAGGVSGVLKTATAGFFWAPMNNGLPVGTSTYALASGPSEPQLYVPVPGCRLADTRFNGTRLPAGSSVAYLPWMSNCGVPPTATAYAVNVTAVPPGPLAFLSMWPSGEAQPTVSTLNSYDGRIRANAAIVPAGTQGAVLAYATNPSDVVLDVNGYFSPARLWLGSAFYPLNPCRLADTRSPGQQPLAPGESRQIPITGSRCWIPTSATAYSLNITAVPYGPLAYLSAWQIYAPQPSVSTLNAPTGAITANAAIIQAGSLGDINVFATDRTDVVVDVNGYFRPPGPDTLMFYPMGPCRLIDTRLTGGAMQGGEIRTFARGCGIPLTAKAYSLNATVVPAGRLGYLTLWPYGGPQPFVSTLNSSDGTIVSNAAIVPAGLDGAINAYVTDATHLILDMNGYFAP